MYHYIPYVYARSMYFPNALSIIVTQRYIPTIPVMIHIQFIHIPMPIEINRLPMVPKTQAFRTLLSISNPCSSNPGSSDLASFALVSETPTRQTKEAMTPQTIGSGSFIQTATEQTAHPDIMPAMHPWPVQRFQKRAHINGRNIIDEKVL